MPKIEIAPSQEITKEMKDLAKKSWLNHQCTVDVIKELKAKRNKCLEESENLSVQIPPATAQINALLVQAKIIKDIIKNIEKV